MHKSERFLKSIYAIPSCQTVHIFKINTPIVRSQPRQILVVNFIGEEDSAPTDPEKFCDGNYRTKYCRNLEKGSNTAVIFVKNIRDLSKNTKIDTITKWF